MISIFTPILFIEIACVLLPPPSPQAEELQSQVAEVEAHSQYQLHLKDQQYSELLRKNKEEAESVINTEKEKQADLKVGCFLKY